MFFENNFLQDYKESESKPEKKQPDLPSSDVSNKFQVVALSPV